MKKKLELQQWNKRRWGGREEEKKKEQRKMRKKNRKGKKKEFFWKSKGRVSLWKKTKKNTHLKVWLALD